MIGILKLAWPYIQLDGKKPAVMKYDISAQSIYLPNKIYKILKRLSQKRKSPKSLVERVQIIILASRGLVQHGWSSYPGKWQEWLHE
jgi:hypothetical protein